MIKVIFPKKKVVPLEGWDFMHPPKHHEMLARRAGANGRELGSDERSHLELGVYRIPC